MAFRDFPTSSQSIELLQRGLKFGRLAHAYLFTGGSLAHLEGVARTLAKALNCEQPKRAETNELGIDSCDTCGTCRKIESGAHPDVHWIRPESKIRAITIDQMRQLMSEVHLKPTEAKYKLGIIIAADRLNGPAANAFLKTLEEPPPKSVLILLSTQAQDVLDTLVSRCQRLSFGAHDPAATSQPHRDWLAHFAELAAAKPDGLLGRYHLLGNLLAYLTQLKQRIEKEVGARSPLERYADINPTLREQWEYELSASIESEYRRERADLMVVVQTWLRDVWLFTLGALDEFISFSTLSPLSRTVANRITADDAAQNIQTVDDLRRILDSNVQEALAIEVSLLKLKL